MISFWQIFLLEARSLWRSGTLALTACAALAWTFAVPAFVQGDGTPDGVREVVLRYSLGGAFALLSVIVLAAAAGSVSRERESRRLQMTLVRPASRFAAALARMAALALAGALVMGAVVAVEAVRVSAAPPCRHVSRPLLPSPAEEAAEMYDVFMDDPETPEAVKKADRAVVLRLLERRALDHYQTIPTNDVASWTFRVPEGGFAGALSARFLLAGSYAGAKGDVDAAVSFCGATGAVVRTVRSVVEVPLAGAVSCEGDVAEMKFANNGDEALMLRPRADVALLEEADGFHANLLRAYVVMAGMLAALAGFGVFLGSALGRPVAVFCALVLFTAAEVGPDVIEEYPDELETDRRDAIALAVTRAVASVARPLSAFSPVERLVAGECVEWRDAAVAAAGDFVLAPVVFALLAAAGMRMKR